MMYHETTRLVRSRSGQFGMTQRNVAPRCTTRNAEISSRRAVHRQSMAPPFAFACGGPDFRKTLPGGQFDFRRADRSARQGRPPGKHVGPPRVAQGREKPVSLEENG